MKLTIFPFRKLALALSASVLALLTVPGAAGDFNVSRVTDRVSPGGDTLIGADPVNLRDLNGTVYFSGNQSSDGIARREPWISRGTPGSTSVILEINPTNVYGSTPDEFTQVGSTVFFSAKDDVNGRKLWKTDGTAAGTVLVQSTSIPAYHDPTGLIECGGKLLFSATDPAHGDELWMSDGTPGGTSLLKEIAPGTVGSNINSAFNWKGVVYFAAEDMTNNSELWRSDGTANGTYMIKDLNVPTNGTRSSSPTAFFVYNNALYFQANSDAGSDSNAFAQLWKTDGTANGTVLIKVMSPSSGGLESPTIVNGLIFFAAPVANYEYELWRSDGTENGTYLVKQIAASNGSNPRYFVNYNNELYFVANDRIHGDQIWKSDGTDNGTTMVHDLGTRAFPNSLIPFHGKLLFKQTTAAEGVEFWETDGITPQLVADINPGTGDSVDGTESVLSGAVLLFEAGDAVHGYELWRMSVPLTVTSDPAPQLVAAGAPASFSAAASPSSGLEVSWEKNQSAITGAHAFTYTIPAAALIDAGPYRAAFSGTSGDAVSKEAPLGVVDRNVEGAQALEDHSIVLSVHAAGANLTYQWKHDGQTLMAGGNASNVQGAQLTLSHLGASDAGAYTCDVKLGALILTTLPAQVSILTRPVVTPTAPPAAIVSGVYSWQIAASESPASFRVTGLPSGLVLNRTTGLVSGTPNVGGTYQIKVTATNAAGASVVQTFTLTIAPLPAGVVGTFDGVLGRDSNLNGDLGGTVTATVAPAGGFSGKIVLGASTHPFLSRIQATVQHDPTAVLTLIRPGSTPITATLSFDSAGSALTGTLTGGGHSTSLLGGRRTWNATANPALQFAGSYNAALDLTGAAIGNLAYPQGSGSLQLKVTKAGVVSVAGTMSDGSPLSSSSHLWQDGRIPICKLLNANHGSLRGFVQITVGGAAPDFSGNRAAAAGLDWIKTEAAGPLDRTYRAGIPRNDLAVDGSKYVPEMPGTNVLETPDAANNAKLQFTQGGIGSAAQHASVDQIFQLTGVNLAKFTAANPTQVKLTVYPASGAFRGSFTLTDSNPAGGHAIVRNVLFSGLVLQHLHAGRGWFLLPQLPPPATSDILGGAVAFGVNP